MARHDITAASPQLLSVTSVCEEFSRLANNESYPDQNSSTRVNLTLRLFQMARDGDLSAFQALEEHAGVVGKDKFSSGYVAVLLTSDKVAVIQQDLERAANIMTSLIVWLTEQVENESESLRHAQFLLVSQLKCTPDIPAARDYSEVAL
jgi:hypothetical protein